MRWGSPTLPHTPNFKKGKRLNVFASKDTNVKILPNIAFKKFFTNFAPNFYSLLQNARSPSPRKILKHETQNKNKHRLEKYRWWRRITYATEVSTILKTFVSFFMGYSFVFASFVTCYLFILKERKRFFNFFFLFNFSILLFFLSSTLIPFNLCARKTGV